MVAALGLALHKFSIEFGVPHDRTAAREFFSARSNADTGGIKDAEDYASRAERVSHSPQVSFICAGGI
jgi:hypothetical protein